MSDNQTKFEFSPRPEAHAMKWDELLTPVKCAVRDLLIRIEGAEKNREENHNANNVQDMKEVSSCFLVYGSRGTGKTTVLFSAQEAVCRREKGKEFFGKEKPDESTHEGTLKKRALECAEYLKTKQHIVWLNPLDLEPLAPNTNLLTTLLTRVRNALDPTGCENKGTGSTSIFEEGADSARQQFGRLINDATLMWEEIQETDTRNKANRQIAAADIYASFRSRFKKAMDDLSKKLDRQHGQDEGCSIILPIDNIDRSTDHLESIIKLAQMVSHPCLWLVMAGDQVEVESFLERAYWKELIHSRDGADARGKIGYGGEDEALIMARRQAAATAQKIWPPNHRIQVELVNPKETLRFHPSDKDQMENIYNLLKSIRIPTTATEQDKKNLKIGNVAPEDSPSSKKIIRLIDLFDVQDKILNIFSSDDIEFVTLLIEKLKSEPQSKLTKFISEKLNVETKKLLDDNPLSSPQLQSALIPYLNKIIQDNNSIYDEELFKGIKLNSVTDSLRKQNPKGADLIRLNRQLLIHALSANTSECCPLSLSRAAQYGLLLPARGVLDLWQLAYWVVRDSPMNSDFDFRAEKIARTMLRNVIAGSQMQNAMGQCLQNNIIRRIDTGGTVLDFNAAKPIIKYLRAVSFIDNPVRPEKSPVGYIARSTLIVNSLENVILSLEYQHPDNRKKNPNDDVTSGTCFPQPFVIATNDRKVAELPPRVSSWLVILHDILLLAGPKSGSAVVNRPPLTRSAIVEICHEVVSPSSRQMKKETITLGWPVPEWSTFVAHDVFRQRWRNFRTSVKDNLTNEDETDNLPRLLAAGWAACVLETYAALIIETDSDTWQSAINKIHSWDKPLEVLKLKASKASIEYFEELVILAASELYSSIKNRMKDKVLYFESRLELELEPRAAVRDWLEEKLPLLFSHLYVPFKNETDRFKEIKRILIDKKGVNDPMLTAWKDNWPFILADIDEELKNIFKASAAQPDSKEAAPSAPGKYKEYIKSIGDFGNLHQVWEEYERSSGKPYDN